eukprot:TRINITY_DN1349_c1_g3_i1.p1 TRINITY_DN1349_c1_g3~~TRINITY_DN1349_c1_g3_i1.p1  ORF type:complete len:321 (+),score=44.05 TRINITY_DN1349_c1_g3_i1:52-963(+)
MNTVLRSGAMQRLSRSRQTRCYTIELDHLVIDGAEGVSKEPPIVVVHGMLGNKNNWRTPARMIAEQTGRDVYCVDLRNHGSSPHVSTMTFKEMAGDISRFIEDVVDHDEAILIGHSLGGKVAMQVALRNPELLQGIVVADIAPVCYNQNKARKASHSFNYITVMKNMTDEERNNLISADKALQDAGVDQIGIRQFLLTNLKRCAKTNTSWWKPNLEALHGALEDGILQTFDEDEHTSFPSNKPCLIITGSQSPFVKMHTDGPVFDKYFPNNSHHSIEAGHWVHSQKPHEFTSAVSSWVNALNA